MWLWFRYVRLDIYSTVVGKNLIFTTFTFITPNLQTYFFTCFRYILLIELFNYTIARETANFPWQHVLQNSACTSRLTVAILEKAPVKFYRLPVAKCKKNAGGTPKMTVSNSKTKFVNGMKKCHEKKKTLCLLKYILKKLSPTFLWVSKFHVKLGVVVKNFKNYGR